jgi:hypothetical protein
MSRLRLFKRNLSVHLIFDDDDTASACVSNILPIVGFEISIDGDLKGFVYHSVPLPIKEFF